MLLAQPTAALRRHRRRRSSAAGGDDPLARMFAVDAHTQLPDDLLMLTDKMTMAASLECRVPLLDHELVELAAADSGRRAKVAGGELKSLMKKALADVLPREVLHRPKRGFGAPMGAWLKGALAELLDGALSKRSLQARGLLRPRAGGAVDRRTTAPTASTAPTSCWRCSTWRSGAAWCSIGRSSSDVAEELAEEAVGMRILYVCHRFPYPPKRGGKIRPFNMIRHLAQVARGGGVLADALRPRRRATRRASRRTAPSSTSAQVDDRVPEPAHGGHAAHADHRVGVVLSQSRTQAHDPTGCWPSSRST